jgi:hypothetical protein
MAGVAQKKSGDGGTDLLVLDASVVVKWFRKLFNNTKELHFVKFLERKQLELS